MDQLLRRLSEPVAAYALKTTTGNLKLEEGS